jgi:PKD repeat protein
MKTLSASMLILLFSINCMASDNLKAGFKADKQSGPLPLSVLFEGMDDTPGVFYSWDFGNGSTSLRKATTTMFVNPGTYTVKLTVTNGIETDSSYMSIDVLPNPDFVKMFRAKATAQDE